MAKVMWRESGCHGQHVAGKWLLRAAATGNSKDKIRGAGHGRQPMVVNLTRIKTKLPRSRLELRSPAEAMPCQTTRFVDCLHLTSGGIATDPARFGIRRHNQGKAHGLEG